MTSNVTTDNVFLRNDTIFGACQAIGDDFGIHANWLRIPLATSLLFSPVGGVVAYLGLSVVVLASRLLFRATPGVMGTAVKPVDAITFEANDDQRELIAA